MKRKDEIWDIVLLLDGMILLPTFFVKCEIVFKRWCISILLGSHAITDTTTASLAKPKQSIKRKRGVESSQFSRSQIDMRFGCFFNKYSKWSYFRITSSTATLVYYDIYHTSLACWVSKWGCLQLDFLEPRVGCRWRAGMMNGEAWDGQTNWNVSHSSVRPPLCA